MFIKLRNVKTAFLFHVSYRFLFFIKFHHIQMHFHKKVREFKENCVRTSLIICQCRNYVAPILIVSVDGPWQCVPPTNITHDSYLLQKCTASTEYGTDITFAYVNIRNAPNKRIWNIQNFDLPKTCIYAKPSHPPLSILEAFPPYI